MKLVLLLGGSGQLGQCLRETLPGDFTFCDIDYNNRINIHDDSAIWDLLERFKPDYVINCIANNKVDESEKFPLYTYRVNGIAPLEMYDACNQFGIKLVHISSDFIFDSGDPITLHKVSSRGNPVNIYGFSKFISDWTLKHFIDNGRNDIILIRTSWLFSEFGHNFLTKLAKKASNELEEIYGVDDVYGSPTYAKDLAKAIWYLMRKDKTGVWNISNCGESPSFARVSKYEFVSEIVKCLGIEREIKSVSHHSLKLGAKRSPNTTLYCETFLASTHFKMPHWKEAVKEACDCYRRKHFDE
jgi:dTDP-4-dehydrorhamnose reductase